MTRWYNYYAVVLTYHCINNITCTTANEMMLTLHTAVRNHAFDSITFFLSNELQLEEVVVYVNRIAD